MRSRVEHPLPSLYINTSYFEDV
uniref:Uncharacterized protein n=1 Tax=Arundo donax TaxID=35708 RepID=A0A0A8ZZN4_ARUDO